MKLLEGVDYYIDPETGRDVWTRKFLLERGFCCNGGCRHCPYDSEGRVVSAEPIFIVGGKPNVKKEVEDV